MRRLTRTNLDQGWRFQFSEDEDGIPDDNPNAWESVTLPHTWNALDAVHPDPAAHYRRGIGHYVRNISAAHTPPPGRRLWLEVEAAAMRAQGTINSIPIGTHAGGYTAFEWELTPARNHLDDEVLSLAIQVDNRPDPGLIPSDMSDFFLYGGLTRSVWLYTSGLARIDRLFFDSHVTAAAAELTLRGRLVGATDGPLALAIALFAPDGHQVFETVYTVTGSEFACALPAAVQPQHWHPNTPHLYRAEVRLLHGGDEWDAVEERLGFRTVDFPAGGPFYLNGERLLLTGTHRHEDWAGLGSAVPEALTRRELAQIRAAGLNFIRLGHYPQAPAVLDACDELGLIVWEELPWCRGGIGRELFQTQAVVQLVEMIEQHYNHPAIVFWGLGNELDWESEHPDSSDEKVIAFLRTLHALAHALDPARLTALRRFEPGADVVDVYSPSIWSGWYRGRYEDYEAALTAAMAHHPRLLHAEWGADSHVGRHSSGPHINAPIECGSDHAEVPGLALGHDGPPRASRDGDWSESYALDVMEWHLRTQQRLPKLAGGAQWAFKDFGTPLRPENPIPYVNQKGLVDRAGRPKDVYFLFQSMLTDTPVCHIESPTWPVRAGAPGEPQRIRVYSNAPAVELHVNGVSQGRKQRSMDAFPAAGLVWHVALEAGPNTVQAVGMWPDGRSVTHSIELVYCSDPAGDAVAFACQQAPTAAPDGTPAVQVTVQAIDARGRPVVNDTRRVRFTLDGPGRLWAERGTPDGSREIALANGRASIVLTPAPGDDTWLEASAPGIVPARVRVSGSHNDRH